MKVLLFIGVGLVLWVAVCWYCRSVYRTFFDKAMPDVIAPFQYIGTDDKEGAKGHTMAQLLATRLASLQRELKEAEDALRDVGSPQIGRPSKGPLLPSPDPAQPIQLNARVINVPKLELKVSGVDVSGLFAWAYRGVAEGRAIRVAVHSPANAKSFTVAAHFDSPDMDDIWLTEVEATDLAVVEQIAVDILRQHSARAKRIPEATGLDRKEFGGLIATLRNSARLNHMLRHGVEPTKSEYNSVVSELEPILRRTPQWRLLFELAAKAAENGRELNKALEFSQRQLALFDGEHHGKPLDGGETSEREQIEQRIAKLESALSPKAAPQMVTASAVMNEYPLNLIAVPRSVLPRGLSRVAILGGTPLPEQLRALGGSIDILPGDEETHSSRDLREHIGGVASIVRKVAPNATLIFAKMPSADGAAFYGELSFALERLQSAKPDVLLVPLGTDLDEPNSVFSEALIRASVGNVVVVAAGNRGRDRPPQYDGLARDGRILVADATNDYGLRAEFASESKNVVWAPGVNIPVTVVGPNGSTVRRTMNGTSFSAALVAGMVARLKEEKPDVSPAELIKVLKATAKPLATGGPDVLQTDAALKAIAGS